MNTITEVQTKLKRLKNLHQQYKLLTAEYSKLENIIQHSLAQPMSQFEAEDENCDRQQTLRQQYADEVNTLSSTLDELLTDSSGSPTMFTRGLKQKQLNKLTQLRTNLESLSASQSVSLSLGSLGTTSQ